MKFTDTRNVCMNTELICLWSSSSWARIHSFQILLVCEEETGQLRLNIDQDVDTERKTSRVVSRKRVDQTNTNQSGVFEGDCTLNQIGPYL